MRSGTENSIYIQLYALFSKVCKGKWHSLIEDKPKRGSYLTTNQFGLVEKNTQMHRNPRSIY